MRALAWPVAVTVALWASTGASADKFNIYTYYNYPRGASALVRLNLRTWAQHHPDMDVILLNESNVKEWIPDMPAEFWRMPYDAAKSDILRAGVIYHHGGLYMDTDFLVMQPLTPWLDHLKDNAIVSYSDGDKSAETVCHKQFSSNMHAGNKGNAFSATWWKNLKHRLTLECDPGDFVSSVEKVCCHEKGAPKKDKNVCHIPWAQLEHLKKPDQWNEKHKGKQVPAPHAWPADIKLFCLHGDKGFAPHSQVVFQSWSPTSKRTLAGNQLHHEKAFNCTETDEGDLDCQSPALKRVLPKYFGRLALHLFFSSNLMTLMSQKFAKVTESAVLHRPWLISEMYRRSLAVRSANKRSEVVA